MKIEHTPGPWISEGRFIRTTKHRGDLLAMVYEQTSADMDASYFQTKANCLLIAAAPELLMIAEGTVKVLRVGGSEAELKLADSIESVCKQARGITT